MYDLWLTVGKRNIRFDRHHYLVFKVWLLIGNFFGWCEKYFKDNEEDE